MKKAIKIHDKSFEIVLFKLFHRYNLFLQGFVQ